MACMVYYFITWIFLYKALMLKPSEEWQWNLIICMCQETMDRMHWVALVKKRHPLKIKTRKNFLYLLDQSSTFTSWNGRIILSLSSLFLLDYSRICFSIYGPSKQMFQRIHKGPQKKYENTLIRRYFMKWTKYMIGLNIISISF